MYTPVYTRRFEKDLKRMLKRGHNPEKMKAVIRQLLEGVTLESRYRDHSLTGNYAKRRECHIEPDWLLIYKPDHEKIIFERMGSHADLFR
ncbi:type II toxin-antitoxin system YafQ family toxin [Candidatus Venteria ishoeyi]|uniref:mRNA interferase YafQ n=1 Tax=Candidatus Venteria ishoeyi TaxID=1899563 RepID=A0A1H6FI95_9GAMM|nr:type II toxin-antitoxin system YafQ family toxin [Candidatus Venteria ishoeyi]SEH09099.1 mRNA interferase YafQ [Candidatus Venteria ishoeyi]